MARARREAARLRQQRFRERFRRAEHHTIAVAEIQAEAEALELDARAEARRLRELAAATERAGRVEAQKKLQEVTPHLAALLRLGQSVDDVAALCEVPRAQVRAAKRAAAPADDRDGGAEHQDTVVPAGPPPDNAAAASGGSQPSGQADGPDAAAPGSTLGPTALEAGDPSTGSPQFSAAERVSGATAAGTGAGGSVPSREPPESGRLPELGGG